MKDPQAKIVEAIFLELVEAPSARREELLEARCGSDAALAARVRRLLRADASNSDATHGGGIVAEFVHDQVPSRIASYIVHGIAGEGGMGSVFDAQHESTGRRAAVKLIRAGLSTQRARERFRIEAETLARLSDLGIAQVYDAGSGDVAYPDGTRLHRPFIAMEWVSGSSVVAFAHDHQLSIADRLRLVVRILRAVHHAHQRGVIHRDLKPGNILVTADGQPKIVDFGIARLIDVTAADGGITQTGQTLGTIRYMSPEQAGGDASKIDTRTDVYSVGSILYEFLAGRPLIDFGTASTLGAAVHLLTKDPPRLSSVVPSLQGDIDAIVHKAIERDVDHRYGSAQAFADDIDRYLAGREVSARAPRTIERFVRVVRRNKPLSAAISIAVIAVVAGAVIFAVEATSATRHADAARREAAAKSKALEEAQAALAYVSDILASCTPERDGHDARVLDVAMKAAADIEARFKDQPLALAGVRLPLGRTFLALGRFNEALKQVDAAHRERLAVLGPDDRLTVEAELALDEAALAVGRGAELGRDFDRPVQWFERRLGPEGRETLRARMLLAEARSQFDRHAEAYALIRETYDTLTRVYGPDDDDTLDAASALGFWLTNRRVEPNAAIELLKPVIAAQSRKFGAKSARALSSQLFLATALNQTGQSKDAIALLDPLLPKYADIFGPQHPNTVFAMRILAASLRDAGRHEEAQAMFERAIAGSLAVFGDNDGRTETTRIRMAEMWLEDGRIDEAEALVREVLAHEMYGEVSGGAFAVSLTLEGRILRLRNKPASALLRFEAAITCVGFEPNLIDQNPGWADVAIEYGACLLDLQRPADALRCLENAAEVYARRLGPNAPKTIHARAALADARRSMPDGTRPDGATLIGFGIKPIDVTWCQLFGRICLQDGQPGNAILWLQRALDRSTAVNGPDAAITREIRKLLEETKARQPTSLPWTAPHGGL